MFIDDIKDWRKQAATDKIYEQFKPFFSKAYQDWRKTLGATAGGNFPRVNSAPNQFQFPNLSPTSGGESINTKLSDSLENLATAMAADRATVATLTDTVAKLSAELASPQAKLISVLLENQKLLKLVSG